jgi:hypothetical protein
MTFLRIVIPLCAFCLSMISAQTQPVPTHRIVARGHAFPDHALKPALHKSGIVYLKGVYQHCAEKHLHRYLAEFDFRYNNRAKLGITDAMRADKAMQGIVGKRLMYRRPSKAEIN